MFKAVTVCSQGCALDQLPRDPAGAAAGGPARSQSGSGPGSGIQCAAAAVAAASSAGAARGKLGNDRIGEGDCDPGREIDPRRGTSRASRTLGGLYGSRQVSTTAIRGRPNLIRASRASRETLDAAAVERLCRNGRVSDSLVIHAASLCGVSLEDCTASSAGNRPESRAQEQRAPSRWRRRPQPMNRAAWHRGGRLVSHRLEQTGGDGRPAGVQGPVTGQ